MSRINHLFHRLKKEKRPALIGYLTAGDPDFESSCEILDAACEAGLDLLELGIPFSDPMADGPVIQRASTRAITAGMTLEKGIEMVRRLRQRHELPIIIFSYYNPIHALGPERFLRETMQAGADGVLVVDLPHEQAEEIMQHAGSTEPFHFIRLIAPTTDSQRRNAILKRADGFVYIVSRRGVTGNDVGGKGGIDWTALSNEVTAMRQETHAPLCVGFGIESAEDARKIGRFADGVIIGSAFQRLIEREPATAGPTVAAAIREIRCSLV